MNFLSLDHPIRWLFLLHALAGALSLLIFAIPLLTKKGGKIHVKVGWIYVYAMTFVGLSAFVITPWRGFFDPHRNLRTESFALFLFFISIMTLSSLWFGLRTLKAKTRQTPDKSWILIAPALVLILSSIITQVAGYLFESSLLLYFPIFGYATAAGQLQYWLTTPTTKRHWWYAHMQGMGIACIATVTAFLVTALPRLTDAVYLRSPILWIAPGVIGGTLLNRATAKYKRQFES